MTTPAGRVRRKTIVPFQAGDGMACTLVHVEGARPPVKPPVLLVHGAGVRADTFMPPVPVTIVDALLDAGHDVWLENWRASIDLPPNRWTLDQAALYDHPAAVAAVLAQTGARDLKAIVHCQGSTSFMMAAAAGLVPAVTTIVCNAVSLHPVVPLLSRFKLDVGVEVFRFVSDYMNPQWGRHAPTWQAKVIQALVRATHHECSNAVCKQVSFTYGAGFPSLWSHANLDDATHDWISGEFAHCPMAFFRQMGRSVRRGHLVAVDGLPGLPGEFGTEPMQTDARVVLLAGRDNLCFLPESQARTFAYLEARRPGFHALHVLPGYGHLDVFIGRHASRDVFPLIIDALDGAA